jgi:hypothetical protein
LGGFSIFAEGTYEKGEGRMRSVLAALLLFRSTFGDLGMFLISLNFNTIHSDDEIQQQNAKLLNHIVLTACETFKSNSKDACSERPKPGII